MGAVLLIASGGFILFEGLLWALAPGAMRQAYAQIMQHASDRDLHIAGAVSVFIGVALLLWGVKAGFQ